MHSRLKALAERSLVAALPLTRRRGLHRRALVLALHNVVADSAHAGSDASLHLGLDRLHQFLDALAPTHQFVALDALFPAAADAPASRPRVAVTFDDAYAGALRLALPVLVARGIPATVFVVPGRLGHAGLWWDVLASSGGRLTEADRGRALQEGRGVHEEVLAMAGQAGWRVVPGTAGTALGTLEELRAALALPGVTIASHTWSHPDLTRLSDPELHEELKRSRVWLEAEAGPAARPWLAYPYGHHDPRVAAAAKAAGYQAAFRVTGGWTDVPPGDRFVAARLNVPAGMSADGIRLRGAGLFC